MTDDPIEAAANYLAQGKISQADYAATGKLEWTEKEIG
jgi:hypothetical protein